MSYGTCGGWEGAGVRGILCYRSAYGTQWHLMDEHGFSWCGLAPNSVELREAQGWDQTADQDRCHKCSRFAPLPVTFYRVRRGRLISERVVTLGAPYRGRLARDTWAYAGRTSSPRRSVGESGRGTATPPHEASDRGAVRHL